MLRFAAFEEPQLTAAVPHSTLLGHIELLHLRVDNMVSQRYEDYLVWTTVSLNHNDIYTAFICGSQVLTIWEVVSPNPLGTLQSDTSDTASGDHGVRTHCRCVGIAIRATPYKARRERLLETLIPHLPGLTTNTHEPGVDSSQPYIDVRFVAAWKHLQELCKTGTD